MAITISGENNNDRILASDGVIDQISGINIVGLITASHINVGSNIQLGNAGIITATTFNGNLTGNVNSTSPLLLQTGGSERFRITGNNELGIAGANYGSSGQVLTSGGSGSAVSWTTIPTQVTISGNSDNRVITGGSGTNLNGESNLIFDGTKLGIGGNPDVDFHIKSAAPTIRLTDTDTNRFSQIYAVDGNLRFDADNSNAQADTNISFRTDNSERLRIDSSGRVIIGKVMTAGTGPHYDDITINNSNQSGTAGSTGIDLISADSAYGGIIFSDNSAYEQGFIKYWHNSDADKMRFGTNSNDRWEISKDGHWIPASDSSYDIGTNATRVRYLYTDNFYATSLSYDGNKLNLGGGSRALSNGYYDDIVIDNSDTTSGEAGGVGISLIAGNQSWGGLIFGDNDAHQRGYVKYSHQGDFMQLVAASGEIRLESGGSVGINSCIHHLNDADTNFGFPGNDAYIVRIAGNSRIYTSSSEAVWNRRDANAGITTQTMLLNWNTSPGTGCALGFAPSGVNYNARHSSIEVVNEGNNVMHMKFKITDPSVNDHALERMRISREGNVSIGGIAPVATNSSYNSASLHIHQKINNSGYGAQVHLTTANKGSSGTDGTQISQYNGSLYINNQDDQYMYFYNNSNSGHRLAIRNDGAVHFGTQTSNVLYSGGSGSTWYDDKDSWQQAQSGDLGWSMWYLNKIGGTSNDNRMIQFNNSGSAIGYIQRSGSNVVYQTSSDYRLKKDVVSLPNGIERVKQLRPVAFKWIEDNSDMEGFLAHEAQEVVPYAVSGKKDEVATEDFGDRKKGDMIVQAVDYGEFTPLLTAAMKELIAKVETLEAEIAALKGS